MQKLLGSSAVSRMLESGEIQGYLESWHWTHGPSVDSSGPIELDGSGVPIVPMDVDERRWLGHGD